MKNVEVKLKVWKMCKLSHIGDAELKYYYKLHALI